MTDQEINIAIAEACGWKQAHIMQMGPKGKYVRTYQKGRGKLHQKLPDYLNDLNAMHEAEKTIENKNLYEEWLESVCGGRQYLFHATARQRAEAFLRKIWKWKENWK